MKHIPTLNQYSGSWVVYRKSDGMLICELSSDTDLIHFNFDKYCLIGIADHLNAMQRLIDLGDDLTF
jgi:hypothetical protein